MRSVSPFFILIVLFSALCLTATAQVGNGMKQPRILILLDESSSMIEKWSGNEERYKAAEQIILSLMDSVYDVNQEVEFGLRALGEQYNVKDMNCYDTRNEVSFSKNNRTQIMLRLDDLHPLGTTPIAYALKEAAEKDLVDDYKNIYSLVLITDGGEACGGNICEVAKMLMERKIHFKPYIISMVDDGKLKLEYDCLGTFLPVTKPSDIPKAVSTIVDSYRPTLTQIKQNADPKEFKTDIVISPSILKVETPAFKITQEVKKPQTREKVIPPAPVEQPKPEPKPVPPPVQKVEPKIEPKIEPKPEPKPQPKVEPVPEPKPQPKPKEDISFIQVRNTMRYLAAKAPQMANTKAVIVPKVPMPAAIPPSKPVAKIEPKKVVAPVVEKPKPPTEKQVSYQKYDVKSSETTLEVFFTDGKGKYYSTSPQVVLKDPATGNAVQTFYRTVNAAGEPDAQKVAPGIYNLTVKGKNSLLAKSVEIKPDMTAKLTIVVSRGSLHFQYANNPDKPVTEYIANVAHRVNGGANVTQRCDKDLEYETGNYHIQVSTKPIMQRNVDIDFENTTVITINEPGFLKFTNTNNMGNVSLYYPLGDQYMRFYGVDVNGSSTEKLDLLPGIYQVRYFKQPRLPYADEIVVPFTIKSNETLTLELPN